MLRDPGFVEAERLDEPDELRLLRIKPNGSDGWRQAAASAPLIWPVRRFSGNSPDATASHDCARLRAAGRDGELRDDDLPQNPLRDRSSPSLAPSTLSTASQCGRYLPPGTPSLASRRSMSALVIRYRTPKTSALACGEIGRRGLADQSSAEIEAKSVAREPADARSGIMPSSSISWRNASAWSAACMFSSTMFEDSESLVALNPRPSPSG